MARLYHILVSMIYIPEWHHLGYETGQTILRVCAWGGGARRVRICVRLAFLPIHTSFHTTRARTSRRSCEDGSFASHGRACTTDAPLRRMSSSWADEVEDDEAAEAGGGLF